MVLLGNLTAVHLLSAIECPKGFLCLQGLHPLMVPLKTTKFCFVLLKDMIGPAF